LAGQGKVFECKFLGSWGYRLTCQFYCQNFLLNLTFYCKDVISLGRTVFVNEFLGDELFLAQNFDGKFFVKKN
jgi:hypothetical protein